MEGSCWANANEGADWLDRVAHDYIEAVESWRRLLDGDMANGIRYEYMKCKVPYSSTVCCCRLGEPHRVSSSTGSSKFKAAADFQLIRAELGVVWLLLYNYFYLQLKAPYHLRVRYFTKVLYLLFPSS